MKGYAVKLPEVGQMLQYCRCIQHLKNNNNLCFCSSHKN